MNLLCLVLSSALFAAQFVKAQDVSTCLKENVAWCVNDIELTKFDYNRELPFPGVKFLDKHCESIKEFSECLLNKVKDCEGEEPKEFKYLFYLAEHLCDPNSHLGRTYRQHVGCANSKVAEIDECESKALKIVNKYRGYEKPGDKRYQILLCLEFMMSDKCTAEMLGDKCSSDAKTFYDEISTFFRNDVIGTCEKKVVEIVKKKFQDLLRADLYDE